MNSLLLEIGPEIELIKVPRGEFLMGSENKMFSEFPPHRVTIGSDFLLGKYPITQAQWRVVMDANPSVFLESNTSPVDGISWDQAVAFCKNLSELSGHRVRLPSESEWEYACRAGTEGDFFFGSWGPFLDEDGVIPEARRALYDFAWFDLTSCGRTHPVGLKLPNPWGLYDMIGNVWEWCSDVWHADYNDAPSDGAPRLDKLARQPQRCLRGGAWDMNAFRCRSSYRSYDHKGLATNRFGLRIAVEV